MVEGNTFLCKVQLTCKTPCGRYHSSLLFRILTPHFLWQVKLIVPMIPCITDYTFFWSIIYSTFWETQCWKTYVVFSYSSKVNASISLKWYVFKIPFCSVVYSDSHPAGYFNFSFYFWTGFYPLDLEVTSEKEEKENGCISIHSLLR